MAPFSPDGRKLVTAGGDSLVKIWDATPMTAELRVIHEARGVVDFLSAKSLPAAEVLSRIRRDPTLSEPVRQLALDLAQRAATAAGPGPGPADPGNVPPR
jgi:hypothetical protein